MPGRLRILFLVHGILQLGFGFALVIVPELLTSFIRRGEPFDLVLSRLDGGLLGSAFGQGGSYRAKTGTRVWLLSVTVLTEAVSGLMAVLSVWATGSSNAA